MINSNMILSLQLIDIKSSILATVTVFEIADSTLFTYNKFYAKQRKTNFIHIF